MPDNKAREKIRSFFMISVFKRLKTCLSKYQSKRKGLWKTPQSFVRNL
jgi:hypothetical protein